MIFFRIYRYLISPALHLLAGGGINTGCRFEISCSRYSEDAFKNHKPWTAFYLSGKRILSCHPWTKEQIK